MKVIFLKDVKGQGKIDEIKEVKDGYAKFLISSGSAVQYSTRSLDVLNKQVEKRQNIEDEEIKNASDLKKKLEKLSLEFSVKTGELDKVFGSVSVKSISEELKKKGFDVDKKKIKSNTDLNTLGTHLVNVELHKKVIASLNIKLVK